MANPRVHEIANELGIDSKIALEKLKDMGEFVKSASSSIAPPVARRLKAALPQKVAQQVPPPRPAVATPAVEPARLGVSATAAVQQQVAPWQRAAPARVERPQVARPIATSSCWAVGCVPSVRPTRTASGRC